ncbi:hypothetical protein SeMB42_g00488 [Synchytrium endobioticum]|uniref:Presequence translocated-associated motor subunit PAM17 n=1 Tax=Synchytrium endobioticum TaxID=286115 RepID=A0A507DT51_9FUNG|nr:hypothetical protein SeLEV6574_g00347 [Synchytrium endobioticum]TPX54050.1 hypothetical protein SeMB42_g00488 [Synchytrium endobioticum]
MRPSLHRHPTIHPRAASTSTPTQPPHVSRGGIPWSQYFALRHQRTTFERSGAILGGIFGLCGGSYYFGAVADFDPTTPIFGIDPAIAFTLGAAGVSAGCIVAGIVTGGAVWRVLKRDVVRLVDARDKEFFERVSKYRSDASKSSPQNQIPDYYGEKIKSIQEYRLWLKKQRIFQKKAEIKLPL